MSGRRGVGDGVIGVMGGDGERWGGLESRGEGGREENNIRDCV